jgi:hypothetical protein
MWKWFRARNLESEAIFKNLRGLTVFGIPLARLIFCLPTLLLPSGWLPKPCESGAHTQRALRAKQSARCGDGPCVAPRWQAKSLTGQNGTYGRKNLLRGIRIDGRPFGAVDGSWLMVGGNDESVWGNAEGLDEGVLGRTFRSDLTERTYRGRDPSD